jgi:hypothetical protein
MSLFEYGYDKGAIAGFQAMPGFLQVFGYQTATGAWAIKVGILDPFHRGKPFFVALLQLARMRRHGKALLPKTY